MAELREKRFKTPQEKRLRRMMIEHEVSISDIADYEDITIPAVCLRLKSLTPSSMQRLEDIIIELSIHQSPQKVAG